MNLFELSISLFKYQMASPDLNYLMYFSTPAIGQKMSLTIPRSERF